LAALAAPLVLFRESFFPFISVKAIFFRTSVELGLAALLLHLIFSTERDTWQRLWKRLKQPLVIAVAVFTFAFIITSLAGTAPGLSFWSNFERGEGGFQVLHYLLFFLLLVLLFPKREQLRWPLFTHLIVSFFVSVYALLQLAAVQAFFTASAGGGSALSWIVGASTRVSGTLGNPSYLAAYLLFTFAVISYLFINYKATWLRWSLGVLFFFQVFILLKTGTRGALLGLIAAVIILLITNFFISKKQLTKQILLGLAALPIILMTFFFQYPEATVWSKIPGLDRLTNLESAVTGIQPRLWTWQSGLDGFADRPLLGWGAENFAVPFDRHYDARHFGIESFFDRTHNVFLEYAISGGLLVLIPWLAIWVVYYRVVSRRKRDIWWSVLLAMPAAYLIQGFFLFDVLAIYLALFLFLALVVNTPPTPEESEQADLDAEMGASGLKVILGGLVLLIIFTNLYMTAYRPLQKNFLLTQGVVFDQITLSIPLENQERAQQFLQSFDKTVGNYQTAYEYDSVVGQEETIGSFTKFFISVMERITQVPPLATNSQVRARLAEVLGLANEWYEAHPTIDQNLKNRFINAAANIQYSLVPTADASSVVLADTEYLERGVAQLEDALMEAPNRIEYVRVLLKVSQVAGDEEARAKWLERAKELRPDMQWE